MVLTDSNQHMLSIMSSGHLTVPALLSAHSSIPAVHSLGTCNMIADYNVQARYAAMHYAAMMPTSSVQACHTGRAVHTDRRPAAVAAAASTPIPQPPPCYASLAPCPTLCPVLASPRHQNPPRKNRARTLITHSHVPGTGPCATRTRPPQTRT